MADKKKQTKKPSASSLGSGMAASAAKAAVERNKKLCSATGGTYNPSTGRCK